MGKKWMYILISAVLVVILAVSGGLYYYNSSNYAVKVDGQKVTKAEYKFFLSSGKAQLTSLGITDMKQKVQDKTAEELVREGALDSAVEFKIQLIKAKEYNITLTSEEKKTIESSFNTNVIQQAGGSKLEADKKIRADVGISLEEYETIYKNYYLIQKFKSEEAKKIKVTDEDVKKKYDENPKDYDEITVRHILFMTIDQATQQPLSEDKVKEAEKKANDTLAKVNAGGDFAALAKELSEDPGSKDKGGEYTITKNGQMVPEFEDWTFKHNPGETGIVKTSYGYHVMKVEKRTTRAFDTVKQSIKDEMINTKFDESYKKQLESWKKDAKYKPVKNEKVMNSIKV